MSDLLDLNSLSPSRFERICKAFLEIDTGKAFKTYTEGADGGIDIRYFANKRTKIIGQCKRYGRTNIRKLFSELRRELPKVISLKPNEYYLYISCDLTPADEDKIYGMFETFMPYGRTKHIISGKNIEDKLSKNKYRVICEENFDLFAKSKSVLDLGLNAEVINDSKTMLEEIKHDSKLFVRTKHYYEAIEKFFKSRNILITGEPGIGKTFLSKMLVLEFLKKHKNAEFHYSSCKNIPALNRLMNSDPSVYELFYLDDFLGRAYFELKENSLNELKYLLKPILSSKRKFVILNSRRTVLNEANEKMKTLSFSFDDSTFKMEYINISDLSYKDKGLILYQHIVVNNLDRPRIEEIKMGNLYRKIITHKSFFPRLIEFITKPSYYSKKEVSDYKEMILESLNNPKDIYADDLNNNHREIDRMFLYLLRSFDCSQIDEELFKEYFNDCCYSLVKDFDDTLSVNPYLDCLTKLNDCYVKEKTDSFGDFLSFGNPSIIDHLDSVLFNKSAKTLNEKLFRVAISFDQVVFLKRGFLTSGKQYTDWYENKKKKCLSIKFPESSATIFYYFNSSPVSDFDIDIFIDFVLNERDTFTYPLLGVSGRNLYENLFDKYDIDFMLSKKKLDLKIANTIFNRISNYFDVNELCSMFRRTSNINEVIRESFAQILYDRLFDQYVYQTDMSEIVAEADKKNGFLGMHLEPYAREELANKLIEVGSKNIERINLLSLEDALDLRDYAQDYASFMDFSEEIEAYYGLDDSDYEEDYYSRREKQTESDEQYIDNLFKNL